MADNNTSPLTQQFRERMAALTKDFQKELDKQKEDLDKIKQITELHKQLGIGDTGMEDTVDAVTKAVDLIRTQLEKGPPNIELTD